MSDMSSGVQLDQLVFVGFNALVVALNRDTGETVWKWNCKKGQGSHGYVTLLLDGGRLIVSVVGYTYCLDPLSGQQLWFNELSGCGIGVASLASLNGSAAGLLGAAAADAQAAAAGAATAAH